MTTAPADAAAVEKNPRREDVADGFSPAIDIENPSLGTSSARAKETRVAIRIILELVVLFIGSGCGFGSYDNNGGDLADTDEMMICIEDAASLTHHQIASMQFVIHCCSWKISHQIRSQKKFKREHDTGPTCSELC